MKWTNDQRMTIEERGKNLLVSAAAGSGKTAVLVERIVRRVIEEKIDIDKLLIVTFTKAAAAEMQERIGIRLEKALEEMPDNEHLQRQTTLVHHASISTIDSFCLDVVRSHLHQIDLDPAFRVADEGEIRLLQQDVMDQMLEEQYAAGDSEFLYLVDMLEPMRRDGALSEVILKVFQFSQAYPWPAVWRRGSIRAYEARSTEEIEASEWMELLMSSIRGRVQESIRRLTPCLEEAEEYLRNPEKGYRRTLMADIDMLGALENAGSYTDMQRQLSAVQFVRIGKCNAEDKEQYEAAKNVRERVKKDITSLKKSFVLSLEEILQILEIGRPAAMQLIRMTDLFEEKFTAAKRKRGIVDFSDIEHLALDIFVEYTEEGPKLRDAAAEYASQYEEIMIDEYQDSNEVQEILLAAVSGEKWKKPHNRFMVGDVKQSIYGFRQADPTIFIDKYKSYADNGDGEDRKIELHDNFRSRREVIEGVNMIFRQIMSSDLGDVDYDDAAALRPGFPYEPGDNPGFRENEVLLVPERLPLDDAETEPGAGNGTAGEPFAQNMSGQDFPAEDADADPGSMDADEREALVVAERIREIVGHEPVWDKELGSYRMADYGDIAILMRATTGHDNIFARVLQEKGIPVYSGSSVGYFTAPEVQLILSFLNILDNPRQDIPLAAVLRSPIGDLSDRELADIYIVTEEGDLWERISLIARLEESDNLVLQNKCRSFVDLVGAVRRLLPVMPIHELIWRVLESTGYLDYVSALPGGMQRRGNLEMLIEKAAAFENGSYSGLFQFLRYIDRLRSYDIDYGEAPVAGEGAGSVQIMSIHKSKGLEFPVVFVCCLGRGFNTRDTIGDVIIHGSLGLGMKIIDPARHMHLPVPVRDAAALALQRDARGEELRVLYVALTRAREKLILVGSMKEKSVQSWAEGRNFSEKTLSYSKRMNARTPLDLMMPALLRHPSADAFLSEFGIAPVPAASIVYHDGVGFAIRVVYPDSTVGADQRASLDQEIFAVDPGEIYDEALREHLDKIRHMHYGYPDISYIPGKVSVSYLKKAAYEQQREHIYPLVTDKREKPESSEELEVPGMQIKPESREDLETPDLQKNPEKSEKPERKRPAGISPAERGTLYHTFLENIDWSLPEGEDFFSRQLETMIKCGKIKRCDEKWLKKKDFDGFFRDDIARRMRAADRNGLLHREAPFVLGERADRLRAAWKADEIVLVQGIIDAWFVEGEDIILLDYKTDYVPGGDEAFLIERYQTQLDLYAQALSRIFERNVKEKLIWSFSLNRLIRCP